MFNMLKMDLYRMVKTKSAYVILLIMILVTLATTYLEKQLLEEWDKMSEQERQMQEVEEESVNIGMSVSIPTEEGAKVTVYDAFYANVQAKALGLFLVIFAVIFATADTNSGYIKNIGGQVRHRGGLVLSKAFAILVYTIVFMGVFILIQAASNRIFLGYLEWGDKKTFLSYLGAAILLNFALEMICMTIAVLLRNNIFSMIIAICLCMNLMVILYNVIDSALAKAGVKDFQILKYTVTGRLALLPLNPSGQQIMGAVTVALVFMVVTILLSSVFFEKRDI